MRFFVIAILLSVSTLIYSQAPSGWLEFEIFFITTELDDADIKHTDILIRKQFLILANFDYLI